MKLKAHFLSYSSSRVAAGLEKLLWAASLAGTLVIAACLAASLGYSRQWPALRQAVDQARLAPQAAAGPALPPAAEVARLRAGLEAVRGLDLGRGLGESGILARVEALLPKGAFLARYEHDQEKGQIELVAECPDTEPLSRFLQSLEADKNFGSVLLAKQERLQAGMTPVVRYTLQVTEAGR